MKRAYVIFVAVSFAFVVVNSFGPFVAFGKTKPAPTPSPTPKPELVCRTKQKDLELKDWITGVLNELHKAEADLSDAQKTNADTQSKLIAAVQDGKNLANECAANKACADAPLSCWFHRLLKHIFWIAGGLIVVAVLLFFFAPGALKLILSVANFIWSWIAAIFKPKPPTTP